MSCLRLPQYEQMEQLALKGLEFKGAGLGCSSKLHELRNIYIYIYIYTVAEY